MSRQSTANFRELKVQLSAESRYVCFAKARVSNLIQTGTFPIPCASDNCMKKWWKWMLGALVVVFGLLQLTNPARTNPPVEPGHDLSATNAPPPQIAARLQAACYDCHSDETKWPWYSRVAPVSWLVADDVKRGRERLNFSDWPHDHPDWAARRWEDISEQLDYREMPPAKYTLMHPQARLTDGQRQGLIQWADQEAAKLKSSNAAK
jgi:hypothetical protein